MNKLTGQPRNTLPWTIETQAQVETHLLRRTLSGCWLLLSLALLPLTGHATHALRIGLYESPPKIFTDASGMPRGILVEIIQEIARAEGWRLSFERCEWEMCLNRLEIGELDLMPDVAFTDARDDRFAFHRTPALHSWSQVYRRKELTVGSLLDLEGLRIGVLSSGVQSVLLAQMLESFGIDAELVATRSMEDAFQRAAAGEVDVVAVNHFFGGYKAVEYDLRPTPVMFFPARLFFAAPLGEQDEVLAAIDRHLDDWLKMEDSPYFHILNRWGAPTPQVPVSRTFISAFIGISLAGLLLAVNVWWLRRRVRHAVAELHTLNTRLNATLRAIPDLLFEMDQDGRYIAIHTSRDDALTAPRQVLEGALVDDVLPEAAAQQVHQVVNTTLRDGHAHGTVIELPIRGETRWFELSAARKESLPGDPARLLILSRDITERMQAQQRIQHLADNDHLTGLPNRITLHQLFQQAISLSHRHEKPVALLFMDLDHFKHLNDSLGHARGDSLLVLVAGRIEQCLRESDIACRMGGDEFVLVLPETGTSGALNVATRLHAAIQPPFELGEHRVSITASIGIAMYPDDGADIDTLLSKSDAAMYQAKAEGRNMTRFFTEEMQARSERVLTLSNALAFALEREEVALHYQPIVRVLDGAVHGAEALLRWSTPQLGMVSPAEFIPVAESGGQIIRLGDWVLDQAVRQASQWHAAGRHLKVAVNVSAIQFRHPEFIDRVAQILTVHGLPACELELEVTESLTMGDPEAAIRTMQALHTLGVSLAIDDFGTGYSSMSYLRRLGFNKVKIDQSFVRDIGQDPDDEAIIGAIIQLGQSLGMVTLAEGVETRAQRDFLATHGCELMQGWLIGRACPAEAFEAFLDQQPASGDAG